MKIYCHSNIISEYANLEEDHKVSSSLSSSWDVKEETQHIVIGQNPLPEMIESLHPPCKLAYEKEMMKSTQINLL